MKVIEQLLASAGISPIAGVDEAGRGACAGPLVIASVVLHDPFAPELAVVRDSKEIPESKRDAVFELIQSIAASVSVVIVPASEVDSRGVHAANLDGMRRAWRVGWDLLRRFGFGEHRRLLRVYFILARGLGYSHMVFFTKRGSLQKKGRSRRFD